jgi:AcrR family transcriptional regulator
LLPQLKKVEDKPRRYHHGDLQQALVATALQVIAREGLEGLTLRRVGAQVGVSRSALYRHFDDKTALLARIAADGFRLLADTLIRVRENAASGARDTLEVMAAAHVHFARANPSYYVTMFGDAAGELRGEPRVAREAEAAFGQVVAAVREAQEHGFLGDADPTMVAEIMWALTSGLARRDGSEELAVRGVRWVSDGCLTPI